MGSFKHFHEESVNRCVTDQLEEEEVLQALQANGSQCWQSKEELSKPARSEEDIVQSDEIKIDSLHCKIIAIVMFTFPAALGISVCSRLPMMHRPFL